MSASIVQDTVDTAATKARNTVDGKIGAAVADGETLLERAEQTAKAASAQAASIAENLTSSAGGAARRAGEEAADIGELAYSQVKQASRYASAQLREKPLTTLLLAAIAGGLIGHYLSGRR